jgi:hypothetical protein
MVEDLSHKDSYHVGFQEHFGSLVEKVENKIIGIASVYISHFFIIYCFPSFSSCLLGNLVDPMGNSEWRLVKMVGYLQANERKV